MPCDERDSKWLPGSVFGEDDWKRYTATDTPFGYAWFTAGGKDWEEMNEMWETTPKGWIAPMNMANWVDQNLYSEA